MVWGNKGGPEVTPRRQSRGANQRGLASLAFIGVLAQGLGLLLFLLACYLIFENARTAHAAARQAEQATRIAQELTDHIAGLQSLLRQSSLQRLGLTALNAPPEAQGQNRAAMTVALKRQNPAAQSVRVYPAPASLLSLNDVGGDYMLLELLLAAETNQQSGFMLVTALDDEHRGEHHFAHAASLRDGEDAPVSGYLVAEWDPVVVLDNFTPVPDPSRYFALQHAAGNRDFINLKAIGDAPTAWFGADRLPIAGTRLFVSIPDQPRNFELAAQRTLLLTVVLGALLMAGGFIWYRRATAPPPSKLPSDVNVGAEPVFEADPEPAPRPAADPAVKRKKKRPQPAGILVAEMDQAEAEQLAAETAQEAEPQEAAPDTEDDTGAAAEKPAPASEPEEQAAAPRDDEDVWLVPPPELAEKEPEPEPEAAAEELSLAEEWEEPPPEPPAAEPKPTPEVDRKPEQFGLSLEDDDDAESADTGHEDGQAVPHLKPPSAQHPDLAPPPSPSKSLGELELEEISLEPADDDTETETRNRDNKD